MTTNVFAQERAAVEALSSRLISYQHAPIGIILGTGLGQWVETLNDILTIDYKQIPDSLKPPCRAMLAGFARDESGIFPL